MAYFAIKFDDEYFANWDLYRDYLSYTDRQLSLAAAQGSVKTRMLLEHAVFPITQMQFKNMVSNMDCISEQDIDETLRAIKEPADYLEFTTVLPVKDLQTFELKGISFVKLTDIKNPNKYNMLYRLPFIKVCGTLYVAINRMNTLLHPKRCVVLKSI